MLIYLEADPRGEYLRKLVPNSEPEPLNLTPFPFSAGYEPLRISPSGRYVGLSDEDDGRFDIWIHDLWEERTYPLMRTQFWEWNLVWRNDDLVTFNSVRGGKWGFWEMQRTALQGL